jgi:hypothetical protein
MRYSKNWSVRNAKIGLKSIIPPIGGTIRLNRFKKGSVNFAMKSIHGCIAMSGIHDPMILTAKISV